MAKGKQRLDFYSGVPWVQVTPEQARGHPKGKLNFILWIIGLYFVANGIAKFTYAIGGGVEWWIALLGSIWPFVAGLGLLIRAPWSMVMAVISGCLTVWYLVRSTPSIGRASGSFGANEGWLPSLLSIHDTNGVLAAYTLFELVIHVGLVIYLIDSDRANLIYRHRYRQYSVLDGDGTDTKDDP